MGISIAALRNEMNMINRYEITQYVQEDIFQDETSLERLFCDIGRFRQKC